MVRVDPDDPDVDPQPFEAVERVPESIHRRQVGEPGVTDVEMQAMRGIQVGKRLEQPLDRRRADVAACPHEADRLERIVHIGHVDRRTRVPTSASCAPERSEPMSNAIEKVSRNCGVHAAKPALILRNLDISSKNLSCRVRVRTRHPVAATATAMLARETTTGIANAVHAG